MKKKLLVILGLCSLLTACGDKSIDMIPDPNNTPSQEVEQYDLNEVSDNVDDTPVSNDDTPSSHESFIGTPYLIEGTIADYTLTALSVDVVKARGNVHQYITDQDFQLTDKEALVLVTISLTTDTPHITQQITPEHFAIIYNGQRYLGTSALDTNFLKECILSSDAPQQITVPFLVPSSIDTNSAIQFTCGNTTIYL